MKNRVEYLLFQFILLIVRIIPAKAIPVIGRRFGMALFYLGVRRKVVQKNLKIAFGSELTDETEKQLSKQIYRNSGTVLFEILLMKYISPENLGTHIQLEGLDILHEAIAEGKGVVIAGNHFGNWELISAAISTQGSPIYMYAGKQRNNLFDRVLNEIRQRFGTVTISKSKTATIEMMKVLKSKKVLGMAGDLNVPHNTLFVDFFGVPAAVGRGLVSFVLSRKTPLIFIWCIRTGPLQHKGFLSRIPYRLTGDKAVDLVTISQTLVHALEEKIREYPDQYFWFNKRWKTRPEHEKGPDIY